MVIHEKNGSHRIYYKTYKTNKDYNIELYILYTDRHSYFPNIYRVTCAQNGSDTKTYLKYKYNREKRSLHKRIHIKMGFNYNETYN